MYPSLPPPCLLIMARSIYGLPSSRLQIIWMAVLAWLNFVSNNYYNYTKKSCLESDIVDTVLVREELVSVAVPLPEIGR